MANNKKFIAKNGLRAQNLEFTDSQDGSNQILLNMLNTDTLNFEGDAGSLFSISDDLTGTVFSVGDISGLPIIEADGDTHNIRLAQLNGKVMIGGTDSGSTDSDVLNVTGNVKATAFYGDGSNLSGISGGGGSSLTVQDEGSALSTAATTLNFVGSGVTASGTGATKTITISSGSGIASLADDGSPQLGGDLDLVTFDIVTTSNRDIELAPNGTGKTVLKGNTNPGTLVFNCESNSHGQTVKSQPHSAGVTNVLTLPPGGDQEIVGAIATQGLTNKTLIAPTITNLALDSAAIGNIYASGNNITTLNSNGSLSISPNGSGQVFLNTPQVSITSSGTNDGPILRLYSNDHSDAADFGVEGKITFDADNDADQQTSFAQIQMNTADVTDGSEDGWIYFKNIYQGTLYNTFAMGSNGSFYILSDATNNPVIEWNQTGGTSFDVQLRTSTPTADRTISLPDSNGTLAIQEKAYSAINAQTGTTYTTVLADTKKLVTLNNASAITLTIPPNSSVAYSVGSKIDIVQLGNGQVTVAEGSGVTINSTPTKKLREQYSAASCIKIATDTWILAGDLATS